MAAVDIGENEWQAVSRSKQKKKKVEAKPVASKGFVKNGAPRRQYNGKPNTESGPAQGLKPGQNRPQWRGRPNEERPLKSFNGQTQEQKAVEKGSWAAIVRKDAPEAPKVEASPAKAEEPEKAVVEESKKPEEKEVEAKTYTVADIEAELRSPEADSAKKEVVEKKDEKPAEPEPKKEPRVKPGFAMTKKLSASAGAVPEVGNVKFGSEDQPTVDLKSLVENFGKEVVDAGTTAALGELRKSLDDARDENLRLKQQKEMLESQFAEASDSLRTVKKRLEELSNTSAENANLHETIAKLTKQLEQQKRSYYDESSPTDGPKQQSGPPPPEMHYPPQQQMYPPGGPMGYYGGYYPFPNYQQSPPGQRYNYDQHSQPPPGPNQGSSGPNQHYGGHDEFGRHGPPPPPMGMNMRRRDNMDKNQQSGQNQPPPGYGGGNYQYQPYVVPQHQGFPPAQNRPSHGGQQGWNGGRQ